MKAYKHILLATDFSAYSENAAKRAVSLAREFNALFTLLHVIEYFPENMPVDIVPPEDADPASYVIDESRDKLKKLAEKLQYDSAILLVRTTTGSARHEIVSVGSDVKADLIVTATHGHNGISKLIGSTAEGVVHSAPCDVLVIRSSQLSLW